MLNIRKEYSPNVYNSTNYRTHTDYAENDLYNKSNNRAFNNSDDIYKGINQNATEVVNTYKINKHFELKKTYYHINDDVVVHKIIPYTLMIIARLLNAINSLMLQIISIIQGK